MSHRTHRLSPLRTMRSVRRAPRRPTAPAGADAGTDPATGFFTCQHCGVKSADADFVTKPHDGHTKICQRYVVGFSYAEGVLLRTTGKPQQRGQQRTPSASRALDGFFRLKNPKNALLLMICLLIGLPLLRLLALPSWVNDWQGEGRLKPGFPQHPLGGLRHYVSDAYVDRVEVGQHLKLNI